MPSPQMIAALLRDRQFDPGGEINRHQRCDICDGVAWAGHELTHASRSSISAKKCHDARAAAFGECRDLRVIVRPR